MFEYDKIVVGSSLQAVLYAFNNNYPIFFAEERRPFRFDYFEPHIDLRCLKLSLHCESLMTFEGPKKVGWPKELLWERILFLLAIGGHSPLSNLCANLRYDGETIVCSNDYSKIMEFKFNECFYFGDERSTGFVHQKSLDEDKYICYDYIAFNRGGKHQIDYISTEDDLVREIWFYSSDRIDGNTPVKDACAVSFLSESQLADFDYSQTMSRFKVIHEMEARGMKGKFAHDYTTAGNPKYYKFRTTSLYRERSKQPHESQPQTSNITIPKIDDESLLKDISPACMAYDRFLRYW